jgi:uncharacterized protein (DUF983 family)
MLKKGSKLNSILTGSCPRCQKESMYVDQNLLRVHNCIKMHDHCSHCQLKYHIEPSFFYGAMYVGYGLNVAIGVGAFIIAYVFLHSTIKTAFIAIILAIIVLVPIVLRLSRTIYINMFVSYDKTFVK